MTVRKWLGKGKAPAMQKIYRTVDLGTAEHAQFLANMPQLAGNGHRVNVEGTTAALTTDALDVLADLPEDCDGHYDGTHIWIGGSEYTVTAG